MSKTGRNVALALVGTVVLVGLVLFVLKWVRADDDRPPIIVRGGSVVFELQLIPGETASRDWVPDGGDWTPDQPNGHVTTTLTVTIDSQDPTCQSLEGPTVHVLRTPNNTPPLHVAAAGGKPKVGPMNQLNPDNSGQLKTLSYTAGSLVGIRVGSKDCPVTNSNEITIQPTR
jgi:hypothetical protein